MKEEAMDDNEESGISDNDDWFRNSEILTNLNYLINLYVLNDFRFFDRELKHRGPRSAFSMPRKFVKAEKDCKSLERSPSLEIVTL